MSTNAQIRFETEAICDVGKVATMWDGLRCNSTTLGVGGRASLRCWTLTQPETTSITVKYNNKSTFLCFWMGWRQRIVLGRS